MTLVEQNSDPQFRLRRLHESLDRRFRPEVVAKIILEEIGSRLNKSETKILRKAANGASRFGGYSSMTDDFNRPVGMSRQLAVAAELFTLIQPPESSAHDDPEKIGAYLQEAEKEIGKKFGSNDFKKDRLNKEARESLGMEISKRRYNKLFRLSCRMERKRERLIREWNKRFFTLVGKSRSASRLSWETFSADVDSACFIAYLTARCNLRSEFTISGQQRPYDEIADMLLQRCQKSPTANWWAIAQVFPEKDVLSHLSDSQKGQLLGIWFGILEQIAQLLQDVWQHNEFNRETMIVHRGNDSSTWNNTASAWNKARDAWIALLFAMNLEAILDSICFGKVLRLIAGDVAAWHLSTGSALDPDTLVWRDIPFPWEVLNGSAECSRMFVESVCSRHGVDPEKRGWTAPRPKTVAEFRPTPELVHGVTVGHPGLATWLRRVGVFSGKSIRWDRVDEGIQEK